MGLSALGDMTGDRTMIVPEPEDVFLSWLMAQPSGSDLAIAADAEIDRLNRYMGAHDGPR